MNKSYDYNGVIVSPSKPVRELRTVKKVINIDSIDRDRVKYHTNGDFVIYLPRVYENVISMRLVSAVFPPLIPVVIQSVSPPFSTGGAVVHSYVDGQNIPSATWTNDTAMPLGPPYYFVIDVDGLNKTDETTIQAQKSTYTDSLFAKIHAVEQNSGSNVFIEYNDHSQHENISKFTPALGKLDRMRIRTRLHTQQGNQGFIYWTSDGEPANFSGEGSNTSADFSLLLEIEMLDNSFDNFSSFETRLSTREGTSNSFGHFGYGC